MEEALSRRDVQEIVEEIVEKAIAPIQAALPPIQAALPPIQAALLTIQAALLPIQNAMGPMQKLLLHLVETTDSHTTILREHGGKLESLDQRLQKVETLLERDQKENRTNFLEIFTRLDHLEARS